MDEEGTLDLKELISGQETARILSFRYLRRLTSASAITIWGGIPAHQFVHITAKRFIIRTART